jgi:hypothetical protein
MSENLFPRRLPAEIAAELFRSCEWEEAGEPFGAAHKSSYYLFQELIERLGLDRAKYIFRQFGKLPSTSDLNDWKNHAVLARLDMMTDENGRPCPIALRLAKQLAKENEALPLEDRKGPGGVEVTALARHIQNLVKKRERELATGTWFGPITHEQAMRHFGAKNVATISEK